jgi:hypothetical protein
MIKPDKNIKITSNNKIIDADEDALLETLMKLQKIESHQNM